MIDKCPEVVDIVHRSAHGKHGAELFSQGRVRRADAQLAADHIPRRLLVLGLPHPLPLQTELLPPGRDPVRSQKGEVLQSIAVRRKIPALLHMAHILIRALGLHPHRDDKGVFARLGGLIQEFRPDIGHRVPLAAVPGPVPLPVPLLAVHRAQQGPLALPVSQRIEVLIGGQAVAQGVQDGGLPHPVYPDEIGDLLDVQQVVGKIVPVDQPQAVQSDHSSSSSPAFRYLFSSSMVSSRDAFSTLSGRARITVGKISILASSSVSRSRALARL